MATDYIMDWPKALEKNHGALTRIVAGIFAMLGLASLERLPPALYLAVERLLRPTESAVRRLIVIAARGLAVKLRPKRPMPNGLKITGNKSKPMAFRLCDARKSFDFNKPENPLFITVKTYTYNPFNPFAQHAPQRPSAKPKQTDSINAFALGRRLAAVKAALENLPRQAQRMARWQLRRKLMENPKFTSPLRLGPPPGRRANPTSEIDEVLENCHWLAWEALREDSS